MDENDPVACLPFLNPEASDRGRVVIVKNQNHRKNQNRLSPRSLLVACVKLVDDYNCEALPDIAPDDHATILMPRLNASHPHDQTFLTQQVCTEPASTEATAFHAVCIQPGGSSEFLQARMDYIV